MAIAIGMRLVHFGKTSLTDRSSLCLHRQSDNQRWRNISAARTGSQDEMRRVACASPWAASKPGFRACLARPKPHRNVANGR